MSRLLFGEGEKILQNEQSGGEKILQNEQSGGEKILQNEQSGGEKILQNKLKLNSLLRPRLLLNFFRSVKNYVLNFDFSNKEIRVTYHKRVQMVR